jgi:uracil-DNA glycosylase family 4
VSDPKFDGVEVIVRAPGSQPLRFVLDQTAPRYEPVWNGRAAPGAKPDMTLLHLSGIIKEWGPEQAPKSTSPEIPLPQATDVLPKGPEEGGSDMYEVYERWKGCTKCTLCTPYRKTVVFGCGDDVHPKILVLGEAPGPEENNQGIPFIGPTGQLLRRNLHKVGINPDEDCYITNSVICYPTDDGLKFRGPKGSEMLTCRERLNEQFSLLLSRGTLKAVLLAGKRAYVTFFHRERLERGEFQDDKDFDDIKMRDVMGWHAGALPWPGIKVMTVYHPSYIARQKLTESSVEFQGWLQDLRALSDWALKDRFWDPRPVK